MVRNWTSSRSARPRERANNSAPNASRIPMPNMAIWSDSVKFAPVSLSGRNTPATANIANNNTASAQHGAKLDVLAVRPSSRAGEQQRAQREQDPDAEHGDLVRQREVRARVAVRQEHPGHGEHREQQHRERPAWCETGRPRGPPVLESGRTTARPTRAGSRCRTWRSGPTA